MSNLINTLRMYAEDMHSATGYSERSSAMSLAADRIEQIESAIDAEMVATHLGVFGEQDDPKKALNSLMVWSESVGGYFAKEKIKELEQERDTLAAQNEALRSALTKIMQHTPGSTIPCNGYKCREPWCFSCNSEEDADKALEQIFADRGEAKAALNLPNLAAEVLKRRDAEVLRRAAAICNNMVLYNGLDCAIRLEEMAAEIEKETGYQANEVKAKSLGYKYAACLCCGGHDTPSCESCSTDSGKETQ